MASSRRFQWPVRLRIAHSSRLRIVTHNECTSCWSESGDDDDDADADEEETGTAEDAGTEEGALAAEAVMNEG